MGGGIDRYGLELRSRSQVSSLLCASSSVPLSTNDIALSLAASVACVRSGISSFRHLRVRGALDGTDPAVKSSRTIVKPVGSLYHRSNQWASH